MLYTKMQYDIISKELPLDGNGGYSPLLSNVLEFEG